MPDWVHPIVFIAIWTGSLLLFIYLLENDWLGLAIGLLVGRVVATLVVSRLPGFWGEDY